MWSPKPDHPLRRLFSGLTEQTFLETLGLADPPLTDYLSELLSRFVSMDAVFRLRDAQGRRLEEVVGMMIEAEALPAEGRTRREYHRHIGDFTLFWTGVYPEALRKLRAAFRKDSFVSYCEQGKRSYYIASTYEGGAEVAVLRRLSDEFELCAYGLHQVRKEWEAIQPDARPQGPPRLLG